VEKAGKEVSAKDVDLTGKIQKNTCAYADAIGYLYRDGKDKNVLTFATSDEIVCGSRQEHLKGKTFVISEMTDNGLITHWDQVFVD
jgi:hypothetical protein